MLLTIEQQADMAEAALRFEKRYQEALGDDWRETIRLRTAELYADNPRCGICREKIEDLSRAILWEPANRKAFLICNRGECNAKALTAAIDRYMGRARRSA